VVKLDDFLSAKEGRYTKTNDEYFLQCTKVCYPPPTPPRPRLTSLTGAPNPYVNAYTAVKGRVVIRESLDNPNEIPTVPYILNKKFWSVMTGGRSYRRTCGDRPVPDVTSPRGEMGNVSEEGFGERWLQPNFMSAPVIRETEGESFLLQNYPLFGSGSSRNFDWAGPAGMTGVDMREASGGDYDRMVHEQVLQSRYPTAVPETHHELMNTDIPSDARSSLDSLGQDVHNAFERGSGDYNIDEYSMIMDQLPPGFETPEEFLAAFLRSPNDMAGHHDTDGLNFDSYNEFFPMLAGQGADTDGNIISDPPAFPAGQTPGVGDWYHIQIPGNNGDVMIVDSQNCDDYDSATVQTMTDQGLGLGNDDHPVSGRRQFGMEQLTNENGESDGYRFYTRGFDRQTNMMMDPLVANNAQHGDWSALMASMALEHGGRAERTDENGPVWGWARQVPGEVLAGSIENAEDIDLRPQDDAMRRYRSQCMASCHGSGTTPSLPGLDHNLFQNENNGQGQAPFSPIRDLYGEGVLPQEQGQTLTDAQVDQIRAFLNQGE